MSSKQFRLIPIERRLTKLNLNQREARGASGAAFIPDSVYLFPMQRNGKLVMQTVTVFKNLPSPLILDTDAIDNLGITYLSRTKSLIFQDNLTPKDFQKANLKIIGTLKIPAHTDPPVRLGTTLGKIKSQCLVVSRRSRQLQVWSFLTYLYNRA
jgi:hypothetical protein